LRVLLHACGHRRSSEQRIVGSWVSQPCAGWCPALDRSNPVGRIERLPTKEDLVDVTREGGRQPGASREGERRDLSDHATAQSTEAFVAHRNLLFTVAYEMLGSAADAEDVLQETWLRWVEVDLAQVRDQRAYLVRITTRQSLNRLRTMKRRREAYVGPWLPEPLLTAPDVAEDVELAESMSMALMLVLETLSPTARAVFVLREAFGIGYDEIADAVDKTPAAVRQIAHRARRHVDARRPREVVSPSQTRAALESFQRALETGDPQGLLDVLAPHVVVISDGGGIKRAAPRPIIGADKAARFIIGGLAKTNATLTVGPTVVNGNPALVLRVDGELDGVIAIRVEDARITGLYYVRNPQKLTRVESETPLTLR
jgi:RNA polymerase sigma-70 factor (TIGR02957 family)